MNNPIVSVIIPNYNNKYFLDKLVLCIKKQTLKDWELIIVDDASTDDSFESASKHADVDPRIKVLQRNRMPKGGQTCRNIGYDSSQGKYVIFFDSDDLISENCLRQRVEYMEAHPDIDFSIFPSHSFKPREDYQTLQKLDVCWGKRGNGDVLEKFLKNEYPFLVVSCIYRRESIQNIKWREDIPVRQDFMFNLSVLFADLKFDYCDYAEYDYFYRVEHSANNVSRNMTTPEKFHGMLSVFGFCINEIQKYDCVNQKKYLRALEKYIVNYGGQVAVSNVEDQCAEYLNFCSQNFSNFFCARLKIAFCLVKKWNGQSKTLFSYVIFMLLFWHSFYFKMIKKGFRKLIYS